MNAELKSFCLYFRERASIVPRFCPFSLVTRNAVVYSGRINPPELIL